MSVRSNADGEVGLSLYTDWQLKLKACTCKSRIQARKRAPKHALLPIQDQRRGTGTVGAYHVPRAVRVQRARACNLARVRVPSLQQRTHALATCTCSLTVTVLRTPSKQLDHSYWLDPIMLLVLTYRTKN